MVQLELFKTQTKAEIERYNRRRMDRAQTLSAVRKLNETMPSPTLGAEDFPREKLPEFAKRLQRISALIVTSANTHFAVQKGHDPMGEWSIETRLAHERINDRLFAVQERLGVIHGV